MVDQVAEAYKSTEDYTSRSGFDAARSLMSVTLGRAGLLALGLRAVDESDIQTANGAAYLALIGKSAEDIRPEIFRNLGLDTDNDVASNFYAIVSYILLADKSNYAELTNFVTDNYYSIVDELDEKEIDVEITSLMNFIAHEEKLFTNSAVILDESKIRNQIRDGLWSAG